MRKEVLQENVTVAVHIINKLKIRQDQKERKRFERDEDLKVNLYGKYT